MTLKLNNKLFSFDRPLVMGILNITPDSFFDGGRHNASAETIRRRIDQILSEGADIVDMGAYSSRSGAADVPADEEWQRLERGFEVIHKYFPDAVVSVDTFRSDVAAKCVEQGGAAIINDISAGLIDNEMFATVARLGVPYVLMHMQGTPDDMQNNPTYTNVLDEVMTFFSQKLNQLRLLGVKDVILDPGFGFGKTLEHNYTLMRNLDKFGIFNLPILVGISRKSMIYKLLGHSPQDSLNGTTVLNTISLMHGANILRVHDVREAVECVKIMKYYTDLKL